eukprot:COSAG06_NODE_11432_length_1511_cov_1.965297_2_plen_183_part_00
MSGDEEKMEQAKKTCHRVAQEVLMTERSYVANLRNLHELYYKRLHLACFYPKDHPQRFLELDVVLRLFSNIEDLVLINEELLGELERNAVSKQTELDQALHIGAIFLKMAFALILCTHHSHSPAHPQHHIALHCTARAMHHCSPGWWANCRRSQVPRQLQHSEPDAEAAGREQAVCGVARED